jgi:DNA-binding protein YbaB
MDFGQMKEMYALKKQADALKKQMENIKVEVSEGNFTMTMKGDQTVETISEDGESRDDLVKLFNKGVKESQKKVAQKMKGQLGDFKLPGM